MAFLTGALRKVSAGPSIGARLLLTCAAASLAACSSTLIETDAAGLVSTSAPIAGTSSRPACTAARHVLLLSSGGADGAFGAGVLAGWTETGRRPRFDVVAGASTGALQAVLAFLGPSEDARLAAFYTTTRTQDVLRPNGRLGFLFKSGIYDLHPLRRRLQEVVDDALLDRVAAEHEAGRRLFVASTDLTRGRQAFWDMGAVAASNAPDRRDRFIGALLASVAVPGLIEPVLVRDGTGGVLHGDGAVKTPIPFAPWFLEHGCSRRATVWVVGNGHVSSEAAVRSDAKGALSLARRGVSQLLRHHLYTSAVAAGYQVREAGAAFRLLALPDDEPEAVDPFRFEAAEMKRLFETGRRLGRDPGAWSGTAARSTPSSRPGGPPVEAAERRTGMGPARRFEDESAAMPVDRTVRRMALAADTP